MTFPILDQPISLIKGNTGDVVSSLAGTISIIGSGDIRVVGKNNSLQIELNKDETIVWEEVSSSVIIQSNHGYIITAGAPILQLPLFSTVGQELRFILSVDGESFTISQNDQQQILVNGVFSTKGSAGMVYASMIGQYISMICVEKDRLWCITNIIGTISIK